MTEKEDPLLRQVRVEMANTMANEMIDTINEHMRTHGVDDPNFGKIMIATILTVTESIEEVVPGFEDELADMILHKDEWKTDD